MPSVEWNKQAWNDQFDWSQNGDDWSTPWGTPYGQWHSTIMPRIGSFLPAKNVLEIAPGFGRWTQFLLKFSEDYTGIDLSEKCASACKKRFPNARFEVNDGVSLQTIADRKYNLVFTFDSLVHADWDAVGGYIPQILALLGDRGVCFMHHSNLGDREGASYGHRSEDVSAARVRNYVEAHQGIILAQELITWGNIEHSDCFTLFGLKKDWNSFSTIYIDDCQNTLSGEALRSSTIYSHYKF